MELSNNDMKNIIGGVEAAGYIICDLGTNKTSCKNTRDKCIKSQDDKGNVLSTGKCKFDSVYVQGGLGASYSSNCYCD